MKINANMLKVVAPAMVALAGCSQNQVLASLEASVAATEALVVTLQATGKMSPATASEIESAIAGLPVAFRQTATELTSNDNTAEKALKISGYYASTIAALRMLPPDARVYATAITASIQAFLSGLRPAQLVRSVTPEVAREKPDSKRLKALSHRAAFLGVQLGGLQLHVARTGPEAVR